MCEEEKLVSDKFSFFNTRSFTDGLLAKLSDQVQQWQKVTF